MPFLPISVDKFLYKIKLFLYFQSAISKKSETKWLLLATFPYSDDAIEVANDTISHCDNF